MRFYQSGGRLGLWLAFFSIYALSAAPGHAQADKPVAPPPRSVADLLRTLEAIKPDPARVEKLRAAVKQEPPPGANDNALGEFYLERGRARWDLGMTAEALADWQTAADHFSRGHIARFRALADLTLSQAEGGRPSDALASAERLNQETAGAMPGFGLFADTVSAHIYAAVGDFEGVKRKLAAVESRHATLKITARNASETMQHNWDLQVERVRSLAFQNDGKWAEAETAERRSLRARQRALEAYPRFADLTIPRRETFQSAVERGNSQVAEILTMRGQLAEAEIFSREAVRLSLERLGRAAPVTARHLQQLARILIEQGRIAEGLALAQEALRSIEQSGAIEGSLVLASVRRTLIGAQVAAGQYADAVSVFERYRDGAQKDPALARSLAAGDVDWVIA